jgi:hypothetical protein
MFKHLNLCIRKKHFQSQCKLYTNSISATIRIDSDIDLTAPSLIIFYRGQKK